MIKGYPVGTFIFWLTRDRLRAVRELGNIKLPDPKEGELLSFVLDGQQRLTSLYAALNGLAVERPWGQRDDSSKIYIDLDAREDEQIVVMDVSGKAEHSYIPLRDLLRGGLVLLASYPPNYLVKLEEYKKRMATEIFTRINVGGKPLTLFEIMVAKTYDE